MGLAENLMPKSKASSTGLGPGQQKQQQPPYPLPHSRQNNIRSRYDHFDGIEESPFEYMEDGQKDRSLTTNSNISGGSGIVPHIQVIFSNLFTNHAVFVKNLISFLCFAAFTAYFVCAILYNYDAAVPLIALTGVVVFFMIYGRIRDHFGEAIYKNCMKPIETFYDNHWEWLRWIVIPTVFIIVVFYLAIFVIQDMRQLQSVSGMIVFVVTIFLFSKHPDNVDWRPVIWGLSGQFLFAILVLRWEAGFRAVEWLSAQITTFINYSFAGSAAMFGDPTMLLHPYVFVGLPMIVYTGAVMSIMYYFGITQVAAAKMAWFVQVTMGTTAIESLGVASNIFLNGMDTMLMLRAYLPSLTKSEFHCFLVGNHATVAGFVFGLFVLMGAPPQALLSAAVMSAPATIAIAKLSYPETEESLTKEQGDVQLASGEETNVFEACANGAGVAGKTLSAVLVNFLAFLSMLAFANASLSWIGGLVGYPQLSFEIICSYLFWPISLLMGVDLQDCREVAKLVGIKVFTSEIIAYQEMGISIRNGLLSQRSASIATYALCGFSGLSTLAIAVGVWNAVCPEKCSEMADQMFRVIFNANMSCFLTACVAGLMYNPAFDVTEQQGNGGIGALLGLLPSYKDLMALAGM